MAALNFCFPGTFEPVQCGTPLFLGFLESVFPVRQFLCPFLSACDFLFQILLLLCFLQKNGSAFTKLSRNLLCRRKQPVTSRKIFYPAVQPLQMVLQLLCILLRFGLSVFYLLAAFHFLQQRVFIPFQAGFFAVQLIQLVFQALLFFPGRCQLLQDLYIHLQRMFELLPAVFECCPAFVLRFKHLPVRCQSGFFFLQLFKQPEMVLQLLYLHGKPFTCPCLLLRTAKPVFCLF